jgi:TrmH family RNA methyltransferase
LSNFLEHLCIVLCQTSHPGNIGAAARAMKNMGLTKLTLVSPKIFPSEEAIHRASGADDLLENARVVKTVEEAIQDYQWIFGTSSRQRAFPWPQLSPSKSAQQIIPILQSTQKVAILFGNEQSGLSNEELALCDYHMSIATSPIFSSLNLAAAVQVISYEIYQKTLSQSDVELGNIPNKATSEEMVGLLQQIEKMAVQSGFMDPLHPKKLLPRLKKILTKAQLEKEEVNILRGFLKALRKSDASAQEM